MTLATATLRKMMLDCLLRTRAGTAAIATIMERLTTPAAIARFAERLLAEPRMSEDEMLALSTLGAA
ncbi:MAG: hypothetical protein IJF73_01760 [Clostridia bacterium]|nr:hypothetical protein [Clostridia bacterium]